MAKKKDIEKKEGREVVKAEPARLITPFEEMERWFEDFFRRPLWLTPSWFPRLRYPEMEALSPSVDIFEEADGVVVKAELPGMKKEDIDVSLNDEVITLSGEKKKEEKVEKKGYYRLERSFGSFHRSFRLPVGVQADKAKAKFKDGVLEIRIPKTAEVKREEKKVLIE